MASNQVVGGSNPSGRAIFSGLRTLGRLRMFTALIEPPTDNKPSSTNRPGRFGRPQGESSVSEAKGPLGPAAIRPGALKSTSYDFASSQEILSDQLVTN